MKNISLSFYWPIACIYIGAGVLAFVTRYVYSDATMMSLYMGFVLVLFGLLKLRDVKGFVKSFRMYDPIAGRSRMYAYSYPYIEILLGVLFIFELFIFVISIITIAIYAATLFGAVQSIHAKKNLTCACIGSTFSLPLSHVSTAESVAMIAMCLYMIAGMTMV